MKKAEISTNLCANDNFLSENTRISGKHDSALIVCIQETCDKVSESLDYKLHTRILQSPLVCDNQMLHEICGEVYFNPVEW